METNVVSLDTQRRRHHRARMHARIRRIKPLQAFVSLWFGAAIFAACALLGALMMVALRSGWVGLAVGVSIGAVVSWRTAGRWIANTREPAPVPQQPARRARS